MPKLPADIIPQELISFTCISGEPANNTIKHPPLNRPWSPYETCNGTSAIEIRRQVLRSGASIVVCTCAECAGKFMITERIFPNPESLIREV